MLFLQSRCEKVAYKLGEFLPWCRVLRILLLSSRRGIGLISSSAQWVKGSGVAVAVAQIQSLARELPCAAGVALKGEGMTHGSCLGWDSWICLCRGFLGTGIT